jgi:ion channel POLLUX/CASTOR
VPTPRLRERVRYRFDNTMSKGTPALIGLLALASGLLVLVVGGLAVVFGDESGGRTLWMSMLRTLDPGTMADDEGNGVFLLLMLTVTVGGIFVVAALIGVLNTGLEARLDELRKGRSRVAETGHTVVVGWSHQVFTVVSELVLANESERRSCVAILADRDKVDMEAELRARVGRTGKTRVVCRTGRPTEPTDLELMALDSAKAIVVLAPDDDDPDVFVIKTLLALANRPWGQSRPRVFAAISQAGNLAAAKLAGGAFATVVDADGVAARLLVQTCRQGGLSVVCSDLLDFGGDEIYVRSEPVLTGVTYGDALHAYETAIPIGLFRAGDTALVNPPMDTRIEPTDQLVLLAEDDSTIRLAEWYPTIVGEAIRLVGPTAVKPERILLLGWNSRTVKVVEHLDRYVPASSDLLIAAPAIPPTVDLTGIDNRLEHLSLGFWACDPTDRAELERLDVGSFDHIGVLMSDDLPGDQADSRTMVTLLHLRDIQSRLRERFSIVSEMHDERNRKLAEVTRADDFVVSGQMVSLLLTQLSENYHLERVFDELFDPRGSEIRAKPVADYVRPGVHVTFATLTESARLRGETAIGFRRHAESLRPPSYGVNLNPDKRGALIFHPDDQVIVLSRD